MQRAANDVMQSILFSAILDGLAALKRASGGLPNQLLRDVQAIHSNVTFADLPKELQDAIADSTRSAFTQLLKEGYAVGPRQQMQASRPMDRVPERQRHGPGSQDRRGPPHVCIRMLTQEITERGLCDAALESAQNTVVDQPIHRSARETEIGSDSRNGERRALLFVIQQGFFRRTATVARVVFLRSCGRSRAPGCRTARRPSTGRGAFRLSGVP